MALVVICGQPSSGKTTAARCLIEALEQSESKLAVKLIDEDSFHLDRNQRYANMVAEKNLRGVLRSEVDRSISRDTITIVDSLNSIKGYRYELWCLARATGIRYCVVSPDADVSSCRIWNTKRRENGHPSFNDDVLEDLLGRFEKPDQRNRWDSPLFAFSPEREEIVKSSPAIIDAASHVTREMDAKCREVRILQPTLATQGARVSDANSLHELDRATLEVMNAIVEAQSAAMGGRVGGVSVGHGLPVLNIREPVGLPELRRLRRTFIKLTGQTSLSGPPPPSDFETSKRMFVDYLNREIGSS